MLLILKTVQLQERVSSKLLYVVVVVVLPGSVLSSFSSFLTIFAPLGLSFFFFLFFPDAPFKLPFPPAGGLERLSTSTGSDLLLSSGIIEMAPSNRGGGNAPSTPSPVYYKLIPGFRNLFLNFKMYIEEFEDDDIEEFEDSEDPGVLGDSDELGIGVELVDKDEFDFLDGVSELATLQSGIIIALLFL